MGGVANVPFTSLNLLNVPFTTSALSRTCRSQHPTGHCLARFTGETHDRQKAHRWIQVHRPEGHLRDTTNSPFATLRVGRIQATASNDAYGAFNASNASFSTRARPPAANRSNSPTTSPRASKGAFGTSAMPRR